MPKRDPINVSCLLCKTKTLLCIAIFGPEGIELNIDEIINHHFGIEVMVDGGDESSRICFKCWSTTESFHNLYEAVQKNEGQLSTHASSLSKPEEKEPIGPSKQEAEDPIGPSLEMPEFETVLTDLAVANDAEEANSDSNDEAFASEFAEAADCGFSSEDNDDDTKNADEHRVKDVTKIVTRSSRRTDLPTHSESQLILKHCETKCELCPKKFQTLSDAQVHYWKGHKRTGFLKCCGRRFYQQSRLIEHVNVHAQTKLHFGKNKATKTTDANSNETDALIREYFQMHCDMCSTKFESMKVALVHYREVHERTGYLKCCDKKFFRRCYALEHIKFHQTPDCFRCEPCDKTCTNLEALRLHVKTHRLLKCAQCPEEFKALAQLRNHERIKHKQYGCDNCDKVFRSEDSLSQHMFEAHNVGSGALETTATDKMPDFEMAVDNEALNESIEIKQEHTETFDYDEAVAPTLIKNPTTTDKGDHDKRSADVLLRKYFKMVCDLCSDTFTSMTETLSHYRHHHNRKGYVKCCNKKFFRRCYALEHINLHRNPDYFRCEPCEKSFPSQDTLRHHNKVHHGGNPDCEFKCDQCAESFTSLGGLRKHGTMMHAIDIPCDQCSERFASIALLGNHKRLMHKIFDETKPYACDVCGKTYGMKTWLELHMQKGHQPDGTTPIAQQPASPGQPDRVDHDIRKLFDMTCDLCPAKFTTISYAIRHYRRTHDKTGYVKCCGKRFFRRVYAMEHIQYHRDPTIFSCDLCLKSFDASDALRFHNKTHHYGTKNEGADFGNEEESRTSNANQSDPMDHPELHPNRFGCDICKKWFDFKDQVIRHIKRVHRRKLLKADPIDPNCCSVCNKWFRYKRALRRHELTHNFTSMSCDHCGKVMQSKLSLLNHIKYHHRDRGRSFECQVCKKSFTVAASLNDHMAIHTGRPNYTCKYCPKTFNFAGNVYKHHRKHHFEQWSKDKKAKSMRPEVH